MESFEEFYEMEHERVFRTTYAFCGDREVALDATQEAFSRALLRWRRLNKHDWAPGWVMTTAFNECKRAKTRRPVVQPAGGQPEPDLRDDHMDLVAALRRLPGRQKQAVILFYIADYPVSVVADLMDVSQGAVKTHLSRARETLKQSLEVSDV